jgi:hypothetical protein
MDGKPQISFIFPQSCLGGIMVSILTIGPEVCRLKPGQGNGFLRTLKISLPSEGSKARGPMS